MALQFGDEHIRRKTGEDPGEYDEDLLELFSSAAEAATQKHFGDVQIPPELVCLVTGWILYSSRMAAAKRRAQARAGSLAAVPAPPPPSSSSSSPPAPAPERPIVGTAPPRQAPPAPPPTDLPPDVPKGWGSYAQRFPPARKATTPGEQ